MLKPNVAGIIAYFFIKYTAFYILLMLLNNNYSFIRIDKLRNVSDIFYYLFLFLFLPISMCLLFIAPLYFSFKLKNLFSFAIIFIAILLLEYFLYTYLASQTNALNGFYNMLISTVIFAVFFYKKIRLLSS